MMIDASGRANVTPPQGAESTGSRVYLVAAVAANGVIGANNGMPWHLPEDLKHFKALTLGHPVIMGRKTFDSILATLGKPLPGRENIVVSRQAGLEIEGASIASSIEGALAFCIGEPVVFVIGGGEIYKAALPLADGLVMTEIRKDFAGDTKFPDYDRSAFRETQRKPQVSANGLAFDFVLYERQSATPG
jgi:dihydrofolate reductase